MTTTTKEKSENDSDKKVPKYMRFAIGGLSGMCATVIIQPLDILKNRMQLSGELGKKRDHSNTFQAAKSIVVKEGVLGMYQGLSANLMRQATYTTCRLGFYQSGVEVMEKVGYVGFMVQVGVGLGAGAMASLVGAPTDIATVRMLADGRLPASQRRNYTHVGNAIFRIVQEEGILILWRGITASTLRAMVGTTTQLVTYGYTKNFVINNGYLEDKTLCHFLCSLVAGLVYTALSNPLDIAKTRIQSMQTLNGKPLYSGLIDVWKKTIQKEGITGLWKGFSPYYLRMGPHTTLLLVFTESFTYYYSLYILGNKNPKGL